MEHDKTVEVYVATHKPIDFPLPDYCRKIQVNAEATGQWPRYLHDNDNPDNISHKNPYYSELTVLYSMWKSCTADIQGLYHYRRYISNIDEASPQYTWTIPVFSSEEVAGLALTESRIISELEHNDVIMIAPLVSDFLTVEEMFSEYLYRNDFLALFGVMEEYCPDYLPSLMEVLNSNHFSQCNMFIARREFVGEYCPWLFEILSRVEARISLEDSDEHLKRIYGYFSEFLLNVYVLKNGLRCKRFSRLFLKESKLRKFLRKIPPLVRLVKFVRVLRGNKIGSEEKRHYADFSARILWHSHPAGGLFLIAELTPKNDSGDLIKPLEKLITELRDEAQRENATLVTRIRLSGETPESLRKYLWKTGVRILQGQ